MCHVWNFRKKLVFSANLNFWIESVCLSSEGKEFHIVGAAKENKRYPNVFVRSLGIHNIPLSEEGRKFLLGVCTKSKSDKQIGDKPKNKEWQITESLYSMRAIMGSLCRDMRRVKCDFVCDIEE